MFSDLVGSTALSARMDPEDLREVISAYQKCVAETVRRFGGFVAKYMGDGVLVYFGYPQAHEDDAERAVRAGLELVAAVGALKTHASLQTRVGIATGLVVVGDLIGSGAAQEHAIVGETPNLAARLQGIAEPNAVVIGRRYAEAPRQSLRTRRPRTKRTQGYHRPSASLGGAAGEFCGKPLRGAAHASGLTPLVGRDEESGVAPPVAAGRRAAKVKSCRCRANPESASRDSPLALEQRLQVEQLTLLAVFCSPLHYRTAPSSVHIAARTTRRGLSEDTSRAKLEKLASLLGASPEAVGQRRSTSRRVTVDAGQHHS